MLESPVLLVALSDGPHLPPLPGEDQVALHQLEGGEEQEPAGDLHTSYSLQFITTQLSQGLSSVHGVRRMKSSRCLYFNEISQTNHQHQQSDIKNSSADHLGIISRLPNVSDGDLEIFSSVQRDELTE